jgi:cyanophycinase
MRPGFALMGGGADLDDAFKYMCERSGGGDFLILRASGDDDYNPYIQGLCKLNSVGTLVLTSREAANDPFVADTIRHAEAVFIAGSDQAHYINWWMDTPVQQALNEAIERGVPVGGTSAGLAVQGEFIYSAQGDAPDDEDLSSPLTLANPFHPRVAIVHNFLTNALLKNVITDTHSAARDRTAARWFSWQEFCKMDGRYRFGTSRSTSAPPFCSTPTARARSSAQGNAYSLRSTQPPEICRRETPLTFRGIAVRSLHAGEHFDVKQWSGAGGTTYTLSVESGVIKSTLPGGSVYLRAPK